MKLTKTLTRQELYNLVWSTPMIKLAKEFGLSDNGLRKKCKKHLIPLPPVGYWAKIEHNKSVPQPPLPKTRDLTLDTIAFYPHEYPVKAKQPEPKRPLTESQLEQVLAFTFPEQIHKYHPLLKEARESAKSTKHPDRYGHIDFGTRATGFDVRITAGSIDRTSRFLQALISLFTQLGWEFKQVGKNYRSDQNVAFVFEGEELRFKVKERVKQTIHVKSEKEKKERHWWGPKYDYVATGELEFSITNMYRTEFKIAWKDKQSTPLEKQILDIAQGFSRAFEESKIRSIEAEKQRKIRAIEEAKREERERLATIEQQRRKDLLGLVSDYRTSTNIMDMVAAIEAKASPCDELSAWLEWATGVATSIDPTQNTADIIERFNRVATEPSWKWNY